MMDLTTLRLSTLVLAIFVGTLIFVLSKYIKIPPIVFLLIAGVLLGPEFAGVVDPNSLGNGLRQIVSLAVAVILFEGGLTLHPRGLKKAPHMIWRLLSIGVIITWLGTATLIYYLFDFSVTISLLTGSLIIVTGPTVIAPLLKRIKIQDNLYQILHWEGVLIDPIGVFIAILCYELISIGGGHIAEVFALLSERMLVGIVVGAIGGKLIEQALQKEIIPEEQINIFVFASALFLFGISDYFVHESGILTVVIAGLILGWKNPPRLRHIKQFKSELTELAIAVVFILLAAKLELSNFLKYGWELVAVVVAVMIVIRPVSVFICSLGSRLKWNERLFLSWIAPRGVVAGSMASLFAVELVRLGFPEAGFLDTFAFSIIAATIIIQGLSAGFLAAALHVEEAKRDVWLIAGTHQFSLEIAKYISTHSDFSCIFIDYDSDALSIAEKAGFKTFQGNAMLIDSLPEDEVSSIGYVLALTDNKELNQLICGNWLDVVDRNNIYRWSPEADEIERRIGGVGHPIWSAINRPGQLSFGIEQNEYIFQVGEVSKVNKATAIPLVTEKNGELLFRDFETDSNTLYIIKLTRRISSILKKHHIYKMESGSYRSILEKAIAKIENDYPELEQEKLSSTLVEREQMFPTILAHGVAVPHAHCASIDQAMCFLAKVDMATDLKTHDGKVVQLMFVLLSPASDPGQHLRLLANIAKIASDVDQVNRLIKTSDPLKLIELIGEMEKI